MAKYRAKKDIWVSHLCRKIPAGETFETDFPAGMKLGKNLEPIMSVSKRKPKKAEDLT